MIILEIAATPHLSNNVSRPMRVEHNTNNSNEQQQQQQYQQQQQQQKDKTVHRTMIQQEVKITHRLHINLYPHSQPVSQSTEKRRKQQQ